MKKMISLGLFVALTFGGVCNSFAADNPAPVEKPAVAMPGGWTTFRSLSDSDQAVFREATSQLLGVKYEPLLVRTQVVAGMNYEYYCLAKVVAPKSTWYPVLVQIFKPLQGKAVVKQIIR